MKAVGPGPDVALDQGETGEGLEKAVDSERIRLDFGKSRGEGGAKAFTAEARRTRSFAEKTRGRWAFGPPDFIGNRMVRAGSLSLVRRFEESG